MATAVSLSPDLGAISTTEIYPLPEFQKKTGLNRWAIAAARKKGLKVVKVGRRKFVSGAAWAEFLRAQADAAESA